MKNLNYKTTLNNTDKFSGGDLKDPSMGHNYQLLYKNFINQNCKKILEIGTANGGFAKFLHDNKFNNLKDFKLVGADITPYDKHYHVSDQTNYNHLYNEFYIGNAFSEEFFSWNAGLDIKYEFVIEDADHTYETQQYMLKNSFRLLSPNGVYICEDICNYETAKRLINDVPAEYRAYSYIWDASSSINRSDDICVVIDLR